MAYFFIGEKKYWKRYNDWHNSKTGFDLTFWNFKCTTVSWIVSSYNNRTCLCFGSCENQQRQKDETRRAAIFLLVDWSVGFQNENTLTHLIWKQISYFLTVLTLCSSKIMTYITLFLLFHIISVFVHLKFRTVYSQNIYNCSKCCGGWLWLTKFTTGTKR
jgi:hypothetical protein